MGMASHCKRLPCEPRVRLWSFAFASCAKSQILLDQNVSFNRSAGGDARCRVVGTHTPSQSGMARILRMELSFAALAVSLSHMTRTIIERMLERA